MHNKRITKLRKECNMTLDELAKLSGTSKSHIWEIEKGNTIPSFAIVCKIAKALNVNVDCFDDTPTKGEMLPFGTELRRAISVAGFKQNEFADKLEISATHLSDIINGKRNPSLNLVERMADVLNLTARNYERDYFIYNAGYIPLCLRGLCYSELSAFITIARDMRNITSRTI